MHGLYRTYINYCIIVYYIMLYCFTVNTCYNYQIKRYNIIKL